MAVAAFDRELPRSYGFRVADIFLSYAKGDRDRAKRIARECEELGYSVWWDRQGLVSGMAFQEEIQLQLKLAPCVMVLWSRESVRSSWVLDEATEGLAKLAPALLDREATVPFGQRQVQIADLSSWEQGVEHAEFQSLVRGIARLVGREPNWPSKHASARSPTIHSRDLPNSQSQSAAVPRIEFSEIPAGSFTMGSDPSRGSRDEHPPRLVTITRPFLLARTPVTNAQYRDFVAAKGVNPPMSFSVAKLSGDQQPAVGISWHDAQAFCSWAGFRLPTESEWEYACRAGSTTDYWYGDSAERLGQWAWYVENSDMQTAMVAQKPANPYGLFDMHGNVFEWCQDWLGDYASAPLDGSANGDATSGKRVLRGGSWFVDALHCRSASRRGRQPGSRGGEVGFRPAQALVS